MGSIINEMNVETGEVRTVAEYSCSTKEALIAYVMQQKKNNNTWDYPDYLEGMRESDIVKGTYYYTLGNVILQSFEELQIP